MGSKPPISVGRIFGNSRVLYDKDVGKNYAPSSKYRPHQGAKERLRAAKKASTSEAQALHRRDVQSADEPPPGSESSGG